jgi:RNA polymerase sigma-70 factor (ECF subfamily)
MNLCVQANFAGFICGLGGEPAAAGPSFIQTAVNEQETEVRDIELLRQIADGDRAAFAEFYDRHSLLMFSVASRILNEPSDAEDVMQEAFVQIWEKAKSFDPKLGKAASWAAILVRNKAIDRIRSSQRRTRLAQEAGPELAFAASSTASANEAIHGTEKAKLIQTAIVELPAEQRRAIEMAYFSGLTHIEISEKLKEPLGTIKARIRRGLLKLREQLEGVL